MRTSSMMWQRKRVGSKPTPFDARAQNFFKKVLTNRTRCDIIHYVKGRETKISLVHRYRIIQWTLLKFFKEI